MCRALRARSGWGAYAVSAADKDKARVSSSANTADSVVPAALPGQNSVTGAPRPTDELRAQGYPFNVKPWRQTCAVRTEGKGLPEVQPGQLPRTRPACVRKILLGAGFFTPVADRSGQETSRTYVQMKAGCIWQWSLTCGHVPLLAGQCRHAWRRNGLRCPADGAVAA